MNNLNRESNTSLDTQRETFDELVKSALGDFLDNSKCRQQSYEEFLNQFTYLKSIVKDGRDPRPIQFQLKTKQPTLIQHLGESTGDVGNLKEKLKNILSDGRVDNQLQVDSSPNDEISQSKIEARLENKPSLDEDGVELEELREKKGDAPVPWFLDAPSGVKVDNLVEDEGEEEEKEEETDITRDENTDPCYIPVGDPISKEEPTTKDCNRPAGRESSTTAINDEEKENKPPSMAALFTGSVIQATTVDGLEQRGETEVEAFSLDESFDYDNVTLTPKMSALEIYLEEIARRTS